MSRRRVVHLVHEGIYVLEQAEMNITCYPIAEPGLGPEDSER
jgi:hypothetical protein